MKKMILSVALASLLFACNKPSKTKPEFDLANAKKEIEAANQNLVELLAKKDSVGFANSYTEDAKFMGYNQPEGRKAIQTVWAQNMKADATQITLTTVEVWGNETTLTEEGVFDFKTKEGVALDKGKYVVVWVNDNGTWKIHRDIFNSDLSATK